MKILLKCEKCGTEKIGEQKFIYVCCRREMQRKPLESEKKKGYGRSYGY